MLYLLELCRVYVRPSVKVVSVCLPSGLEIVRAGGNRPSASGALPAAFQPIKALTATPQG